MIKSTDLAKRKADMRRLFSRLRADIPLNEKQTLDSILTDTVVNLPEFIKADTVLCYYPIKSEPNVLPIATLALSLGKTVAFPISHRDTHTLSFHKLSELSEIRTGEYGIFEPCASAPEPTDLSRAICITPAISFDRAGHRIGWGGGYYDRFLKDFGGISVCVIYSALETESVPADAFDMTVDLIVTEKGVIYTNAKKEQTEADAK